MEALTFEQVSKLLRYDCETGKLFWLARKPDQFVGGERTAEHRYRWWNSRFADQEAFTSRTRGYRSGSILLRGYLAHRVVWLLHTGKWPSEQIDHVNGIRTDNRIENLRAVSLHENLRNQKLRSTNSSGVLGVYWCPQSAKWRAQIGVDGRHRHLGSFDTVEAATAARKAAEAQLGFHANHGRAA